MAPVLGKHQPMLAFPVEDEPVSEEERQAVLKAEVWLKVHGGRGIPMEEVLADFGLTMDDFPLKDPATFCTSIA
jgi:hypothetical protein